MKTSKLQLCKKFVSNPGDDIYEIVESLLPLRAQECKCVFPAKTPCQRTAESPFGFCGPHLKAKKGVELSLKWNAALEELGEEESEEQDQSEEEQSGSQESEDERSQESEQSESDEEPEEEEEVVTPPKRGRGRPPVVPVVPKRPTTTRSTPAQPNIQVVKQKKSRGTVSEESSAAEGSAKTKYVEAEEELSPEAPLIFHMGKFNNYVNDEYKFVLRTRDKVVLGTENKTGGIVKLTDDQIKICQKYNLNYLE